jgi:hypothetical protein
MERSNNSSNKKKKIKKIKKITTIESDNITRINIDSRHRNTESKNIMHRDIQYLEENPITILASDTESSMIVKCKNHTYNINDNIVLQGTTATSVILDNSITFIGNNSYARINHKDHGINFNTNNDMYLYINNFVGNINGNTAYKNIPINKINILHKIYPIKDKSEIYSNDYYYIFMDDVIANFSSIYNESSLQLTFKDINGIGLNYINAQYPLGITQKQGYHTIIDVTENTLTVALSMSNNINIYDRGGTSIWIAKVDEFIQGYIHNNHYKMPLGKTFRNITEIVLISTEIPNTEKVIKNIGPKKNNMFYWKHENDGNLIYQIELNPGNYSIELLKSTLENKINATQRDVLQILNLNAQSYEYFTYNQCLINIEPRSSVFSIRFFSTIFFSNALSFKDGSSFDDGTARFIVSHPEHRLIAGSTIQIINAVATNSVPQEIINNNFIVEKIIDENSYQIKLPKYNISSSDTEITNGGVAMGIKFPIKSQLIMNKNDSIGALLGFRDVGKMHAVTPYNYTSSNQNEYIVDFLEENQSINNNINLSGDNYILMTCPLFTNSYNTGEINNVFAKLLLTDPPSNIIYDRFVQLGQYFKPMLSELSEWEVSFYDANGELFDFADLPHSYTLEIHEKVTEKTVIVT